MTSFSNDIKYIGVDDLNIDLFENQYVVNNGMSYNSYLIVDKKIAIMDTVDSRKGEDWLNNLSKALNGQTPDYLIVHHMEPDHASMIEKVLQLYPNIQIVTSTIALKMLPQFFEGIDFSNKTIVVKEGDELNLGKHTLKFFTAAMVHWPEVIVSYDTTEKVLFTADGFGKFGALCADEDWACEARRYYFNICGKYGNAVQNLLKKVATLDVKTICPLHGPILTENLSYYINLYNTWSKYDVETEGVLIAYASIHGGTAEVAHILSEMLQEKHIGKVAITDLCRDDMAEAIEDAFRMGNLVVAAATYDAGIFPPMYSFLHKLQIKGYQKRRVGIIENGSWAPVAGKQMASMFNEMKDIEIVEPMVTIMSRMKQSDRQQLEKLANAIAKK